MWFLIGEIVVYLLIAAAIGLVVGWLLGRIGRTRAAQRLADDASAALQADLVERDEEIERLKEELAPFRSDDLKLINGIGPVFERTLNSMGFCTYEQVAEWTRDDVRHVAAEIDLFPDRIIRDQWIEQAAALAERVRSGEVLQAESEDAGDDAEGDPPEDDPPEDDPGTS